MLSSFSHKRFSISSLLILRSIAFTKRKLNRSEVNIFPISSVLSIDSFLCIDNEFDENWWYNQNKSFLWHIANSVDWNLLRIFAEITTNKLSKMPITIQNLPLDKFRSIIEAKNVAFNVLKCFSEPGLDQLRYICVDDNWISIALSAVYLCSCHASKCLYSGQSHFSRDENSIQF